MEALFELLFLVRFDPPEKDDGKQNDETLHALAQNPTVVETALKVPTLN